MLERLSGPDAGIAVFTLARPAARNALGRTLLRELEDAIALVARDAAVSRPAPVGDALSAYAPLRALVLASAVPGVFCAGADLRERAGMTPPEARAFVSSLRRAFSSLSSLPVPVFAAVEGAALGGGFELALAADVRVGSAAASFALPETGLGIIPGAGGTQRLPRAVGCGRAKELIFTGRKLTAIEAAVWGVLSSPLAPIGGARDAAVALARAVCARAPLAVAAAKGAIDEGVGMSIEAGLERETYAYELVLASEDRLEGLRAFAEKRVPVFVGR